VKTYKTVNASAIFSFQHKGREIHILAMRNGWPAGACAQIGLMLEYASPSLLKPDTFEIGELAVAFVRANWDRPLDLLVFGAEQGKTFEQYAPLDTDYHYTVTMRPSGQLWIRACQCRNHDAKELLLDRLPPFFWGAYGDFRILAKRLDEDYDRWCETLSNPGGETTAEELARHPLNEILR
jgi:hypothetical protein